MCLETSVIYNSTKSSKTSTLRCKINESARRKKHVNEKKDTERNKFLHSIFSNLFL